MRICMINQGPRRAPVALLIADVAGYTRLMGADETSTHAAMMSLLSTVVKPIIARHEGRIVKNTGDGFLAGIVTVTKSGRIRGGRRDWRHEAATRSPLSPPLCR